VDAMI